MAAFLRRASIAFATAAAGMTATAFLPIGASLTHYTLPFGLTAVVAWILYERYGTRRAITLVLAYTGILATLTGFALLYGKADLKATGLNDWMKWWHSVTSVAMLGAFLAHWARNQSRLADFTRQVTAPLRRGAPTYSFWIAGLGLGAWTWTPTFRTAFTESNYLYLSSWAVLVGATVWYGSWLAHRLPTWRARLRDPAYRNRLRALVDTSLWITLWLAMLTGFALLYMKEFLHGNGYKYVSKWWHTATSVAFLAVVAWHVGFNTRPLVSHTQRIGRD